MNDDTMNEDKKPDDAEGVAVDVPPMAPEGEPWKAEDKPDGELTIKTFKPRKRRRTTPKVEITPASSAPKIVIMDRPKQPPKVVSNKTAMEIEAGRRALNRGK